MLKEPCFMTVRQERTIVDTGIIEWRHTSEYPPPPQVRCLVAVPYTDEDDGDILITQVAYCNDHGEWIDDGGEEIGAFIQWYSHRLPELPRHLVEDS